MKKLTFFIAILTFFISCSASGIKKVPHNLGDRAYNFSLPDQNGEVVTLNEVLAANRGAVIAFYPKDDSKN